MSLLPLSLPTLPCSSSPSLSPPVSSAGSSSSSAGLPRLSITLPDSAASRIENEILPCSPINSPANHLAIPFNSLPSPHIQQSTHAPEPEPSITPRTPTALWASIDSEIGTIQRGQLQDAMTNLRLARNRGKPTALYKGDIHQVMVDLARLRDRAVEYGRSGMPQVLREDLTSRIDALIKNIRTELEIDSRVKR